MDSSTGYPEINFDESSRFSPWTHIPQPARPGMSDRGARQETQVISSERIQAAYERGYTSATEPIFKAAPHRRMNVIRMR